MRARLRYAPFLYFGRTRVERQPGRVRGPAAATAYTFYQVLDGTLDVDRGPGFRRLRPGEAAVVEPGTAVAWHAEVRCIQLAFDLVPGARREHRGNVIIVADRRPQPPWRDLFGIALPATVDPGYLQASQLLVHRLATTHVLHPYRHLAAHGELAAFVAGWVQVLVDGEPAAGPSGAEPTGFVDRVEVLLMQGFASGITIREVASTLGCSPEHLARVYRRARGKRPSRFLLEYRVLQACSRMREEPDATLDAVARFVGLADAHSLNHSFQTILGLSPSRWRRRDLPPYTRLGTDPGVGGPPT